MTLAVDQSIDVQPVIQVRDLSAIFSNGNGGLHVLDHISFDIWPRQFICILGPSGSGKSTLLRILAGLLQATSGDVLMDGEPVLAPRHGIGFVFQKANLMPWRTVLDNITLPLEIMKKPRAVQLQQAQEMVELVGLLGFENSLPRDLSGGMAQRVAIARALIHDPEVLLLDEPFGALDALTRERMASELLSIWQRRQKTVVMVTHSISEALFLADRVLVLSQRPGRLNLDLRVNFERPRQENVRYTPEFGQLARQLRATIGEN
jgi:ABC-type nitrate/sulfonate/bicarbonate transport system ATPase subunit